MHPVKIFTHPWLHEGSGIQIRTMVNFLGLRFFETPCVQHYDGIDIYH